MAAPQSQSIFISYSRQNAEFARNLYNKLKALGFALWRDRSEIEGGENWEQQIYDAIRSVETMVLVMSPTAVASKNVADEWRYARQIGTRVIPIIAEDVDFDTVPRWMRKLDWPDFRRCLEFAAADQVNLEHDILWEKFLNQLKTPYQRRPVPFTVPPKPEHYVQRPEQFDALAALLLDERRQNPVAITTALQGGGGFGKTTLAIALCHDARIRQAFDDGILWITFGEHPNLMGLLSDQIRLLSKEPATFSDINAAAALFRELLGTRDLLIVLDDVWDDTHAQPFLGSEPDRGANCARLITTRRQDLTARLKASQPVNVDEMKADEAARLLVNWLDAPPADMRPLLALAKDLGEWPLMLELAGAQLREYVTIDGQTLDEALQELRARLHQYGFTAFEREDETQRTRAIAANLNASLDRLRQWRERILELAIFPEDIDIPFAAMARLWGATGGLSRLAADDAIKAIQRLSLFTRYDPASKTARLHDVIRAYLAQQKAADLPGLHGKLLDSYKPSPLAPLRQGEGKRMWADLPTDEPHLWDHLAYHLIGAGRGAELVATVMDLRYLAAKVHARDAFKAEADLAKALTPKPSPAGRGEEGDALRLLRRQFGNMVHILSRCETLSEIAGTLHSRLQHLDELAGACRALQAVSATPRVDLWHPLPDLPHPALLRTLEGHTDYVNDCAISPDGQWIVSGSADNTLKVWEAASGKLLRTLEGHTALVSGCAISPDGQWIVSGSADNTLKVWEAASGALLRTLEGHTGYVWGCAVSPDGRWLVSASGDRTLKVWEAASGALLRTLEGHTSYVNGCAISPDGTWLVSASGDDTLKVWDAASGALLRTLEGHTSYVSGCAVSPDGRWLVSASADDTLKVWEAASGKLLRTLEGHTGGVSGCAISPDGTWLVSASWDNTLKVWEAASGALLRTLEGHASYVNGCAISPDGQWIVSGSADDTLKVWEAASGALLRTLEGHTRQVSGCAVSPDGRRLVSASGDDTLKVWDAASGALLRTLEGHTDYVRGCAISPDGTWLVSASYDNTLKVWEAASGKLLRTLEGHANSVWGCAVSPDGRWLVSASADDTLKVWEAANGALLRTLEGHASSVWGCAVSPDGTWLVSASYDNTLKVWEAASGALLRTLEGHTSYVNGCAISPDGTWLVSASWDNTLKVWDVTSGACQATFHADGRLFGCAVHPDGEHTIAVGDRGVYWLRLVREMV